MKNLVLTHCTGYDQRIYDRFIGTLFEVGFSGNLVMFVSSEDVEKVGKYKDIHNGHFDYIVSNDKLPYHIQVARFVSYLNYIKEIDKGEYDRIFLCDSRDVLFQKDIFSLDLGAHDFYAFQEEDKLIGQCTYNSKWIDSLFGESVLNMLRRNPIICSGTMLAKSETILSYLEVFHRTLLSLSSQFDGSWNGVDQGIHNYLIYMDKLPFSTKILTNEDNVVNTVGYGFKGINADNKVVNKNGAVSTCVHQYDRFSQDLLTRMTRSGKYDFNLK